MTSRKNSLVNSTLPREFFGNANYSSNASLPNLDAEEVKSNDGSYVPNESGNKFIFPPFPDSLPKQNTTLPPSRRNTETNIEEEKKIPDNESLLKENEDLRARIHNLESFCQRPLHNFIGDLNSLKSRFQLSHLSINASSNVSTKLAFELNIEGDSSSIESLNPRLKYVENLPFGDALYSGPINVFNQPEGVGTLYFKDPNRKQICLFENGHIKNDLSMLIDEQSNTYYFGKIVNGVCENDALIFPKYLQNSNNKDLHYYGETKNNKMDGKGKIQYHAGKSYEGQFHKDQMTGYGKWINNGTFYEGKLLNGKRQGKGKTIFPDGSYYKGKYVNDLMYGEGLYYEMNPDGTLNEIQEGKWINDLKEGEFQITNSGNQKLRRIYIHNIAVN